MGASYVRVIRTLVARPALLDAQPSHLAELRVRDGNVLRRHVAVRRVVEQHVRDAHELHAGTEQLVLEVRLRVAPGRQRLLEAADLVERLLARHPDAGVDQHVVVLAAARAKDLRSMLPPVALLTSMDVDQYIVVATNDKLIIIANGVHKLLDGVE